MVNLPKIGIIILNWNNYKVTKECLSSLLRIETYRNKEIILVDNGSVDGSPQRLEKDFSQLTYIYNKKNLGFSAGNNVGIRYALESKADYIFLLNNDTIFIEPILEKMIRFMQKYKKAGILGPKLICPDGSIQESAIRQTGPFTFSLDLIGLHNIFLRYNLSNLFIPKEVGYVAGAAFLIRAKIVKKIGYLDERFFFYAEDKDWCFRCIKEGFKVFYLPNVKIIHLGGMSSGNIKMLYQQYLANFQFTKKHYSSFWIYLLKPLIFFSSLGRSLWGFINYLFWNKKEKKIYMKEFLKLSFNIWKIRV